MPDWDLLSKRGMHHLANSKWPEPEFMRYFYELPKIVEQRSKVHVKELSRSGIHYS